MRRFFKQHELLAFDTPSRHRPHAIRRRRSAGPETSTGSALMTRVCTVLFIAGFGSAILAFGQSTPPAADGQPMTWSSGEPLRRPALFAPGQISTGDFESHPAFTPDGRTLFFVKSNVSFTAWTIVASRFEAGRWMTPDVAPFSGQHHDADPFLSMDGQRLYFISDRPRAANDGREDLDIWYVDRVAGGWGPPVNLGEPINSRASEWFPTLAADGTMYFGSGRDGGLGGTDIYRAASSRPGAFAVPENLGPAVNSPADEYEPLIAPDQSLLVFMASGRQDGLGAGDLFLSRAREGAWTPARNLGPAINSPALEISPYITPDRRYFFFASARSDTTLPGSARNYAQLIDWLRGPGNGLGDIYRLELDAVLALVQDEQ